MSEYSNQPDERSGISLRQVIDLILCLMLAVICIRAFVVEGYMVSTGSMAPGLLGYHKRVICPRCSAQFELGARFDKDEGLVSLSPTDAVYCRCPNCDEDRIDVRAVPKTQGDQLLVHKNAFLFRSPDRWEVVVFRNAKLAAEAYVKRVLGLPGEQIRILNGDIFINGKRVRKSLRQCEATQVTVFDDLLRSDNDTDRWQAGNVWKRTDSGFECPPTETWSWVRYQHRLQSGGSHKTSVTAPIAELKKAKRKFGRGDGFPFVVNSLIEFDLTHSRLTAKGVVSEELRENLHATTNDKSFRATIDQLAEQSQFAPISDRYGYNSIRQSEAVSDIGIELTLQSDERAGEFVVELQTPMGTFEAVFDLETGVAQLFGHDQNETLRTGAFAPSSLSDGAQISVRHVDRQLLVTLNGAMLFAPHRLPDGRGIEVDATPIGFATRNARLRVEAIRIIRDIHYTAGRARNGVNEDFTLGNEEYFVLGDNSPVSSDSRNWKDATVHREDLIGKPIVVHLPSSPKAIRFGHGDQYLIRLPDISRIRYIR